MSAIITNIVAFDYNFFTQRYPELAVYVTQTQGQLYFNEAQLYVDNTVCSPIQDSIVGGQRYMFLHMVTAHIAALNAALGQPSSPLVGRISNATEGSVSVQAEMAGPEPGGKDWFMQTKYGAAYWQASAQFRMFKVVPGPRRPTDPWTWALADDPWGVY